MVNCKGRMLNILRTKNEEPVHVPLNDCCFGRPQGCARAGATEEGVCFGRPRQANGLKMVDIGLMTCFLKPELRIFGGTICGSIFATRLRMKGAALEDIVDLLGHESLTMTRPQAHLGAEQVARGRVFAETK